VLKICLRFGGDDARTLPPPARIRRRHPAGQRKDATADCCLLLLLSCCLLLLLEGLGCIYVCVDFPELGPEPPSEGVPSSPLGTGSGCSYYLGW